MRRQARRGAAMRKKVVDAGAVTGLGHVMGRGDRDLIERAVAAVEEVALDEHGAREIVAEERILAVLLEHGDMDGVLRVWKRVLEVAEAKRAVEECGVCGRVTGKGGERVLSILEGGGVCRELI